MSSLTHTINSTTDMSEINEETHTSHRHGTTTNEKINESTQFQSNLTD